MKRPNILVFLTDQQRGDTQPPHKNPAKMPNLDKLFQNGVAFSEAYCPSPHCCPSRATFFSGLYPTEHNIWNNVDLSFGTTRGLFDNVRLFSEDLRDNGYNCYLSGKWHVSAEEGPADKGFELVHHLQHQNLGYVKHLNLPDTRDWRFYTGDEKMTDMNAKRKDGEIQRPYYSTYQQYEATENPFGDDGVIEACVEKIATFDKNNDKPFFMFVGPLGPHDPYNAPQSFIDMYDINEIELPPNFHDTLRDKPNLYRRTKDRYSQLTEREHKESIRRYLAFCSYEDYMFGQIVDALDNKDLLENTIVMYVSDHGDYMGEHGLWAKGLPCFKGAYNICSVAGYGNVVKGGRVVDDFVSLADYAPTFLDLAGIKVDRKFAGKSLVPFLNNKKPQNWRTDMFTQSIGNELLGIQRSVFNKKYKYVYNGFDYDELYDLENDPNEMINIINAEGSDLIVKEMCKKMWQFAYDNSDSIVHPYIMTALAPYGPGIIFEE